MGLRKALLIGINSYPVKSLRGCVNDVLQMKNFLVNRYEFTEGDIHVLLDGDAKKKDIQASLAWLAKAEDKDPSEASVRVFYFSGHGTYMADQNGDEPDGRDECLVPFDYETAGVLTDDALKELYNRFPPAGNLTLVMDCCHSGSIDKAAGQDVVTRFIRTPPEEQERIDAAARLFGQKQRQFIVGEIHRLRDQKLPDVEVERRIPGLIEIFLKQRFGSARLREGNILLAACRADQQAADALLDGDYHGVFTYCLVESALQLAGPIPHRDLLQKTAQKINALGFGQVPQLECSGPHDCQPAFHPFL